jgi:hypothetical protein
MNVSRVATRRKVGGEAGIKDNAETPSSQRWRGEEPGELVDDRHGERVGVPFWDESSTPGICLHINGNCSRLTTNSLTSDRCPRFGRSHAHLPNGRDCAEEQNVDKSIPPSIQRPAGCLALAAARPRGRTGGGTMLRVLHLREREPVGAAEKARLKISVKLLALAKTVLGSAKGD